MNTSAAIDQLVHLLVRRRNADGFREFIHAINGIIFRKQLFILERNDSSERFVPIRSSKNAAYRASGLHRVPLKVALDRGLKNEAIKQTERAEAYSL
jgi:hypothetical protein